ncbi:MAG: flagellar biosynthetic protein FliO [Planctomycetaceae bacterium]|nr:flagellar biosynthetic protein FliO [Planctomycetaceae bacterium]
MKTWRPIRRGLWCCLAVVLLVAPLAAQPPTFAPPPQGVAPASLSDPWSPPTPAKSASPKKLLPTRAAPTAERAAASSSRPSAVPLWGTVAALVVMAASVVVALQWLRRHGPAVLRALPNDAVEPLGQRVLSRGVAVHLVRCGSRMLLLGVGPDGVRTLAEIQDPVEIDLLAGACRRRDESSGGMGAFAQLLQRSAPASRSATVDRSTIPRYSGVTTEVDGV